MKFLNYFKLYKLIEPEKGVFRKSFLIIVTHLVIGNLYYNKSDHVDFALVIFMIGVLSVFVYFHSAEINKAQIIKQYPITYKKRFYYDLLGVLYIIVISIFVFAIFVIILNIGLVLGGYEYEIDDTNPVYDWNNLYGILSYVLYVIMSFFSIQPLKYITDNKKWYTYYGITLLGFILYHIILGSIINQSFLLRNNINEGLKTYEYTIFIIVIITTITIVFSVFSIRKSFKLAKV